MFLYNEKNNDIKKSYFFNEIFDFLKFVEGVNGKFRKWKT